MVWSPLGQVVASSEFKTFDVPLIGGATILLNHQVNLSHALAVGYLTQYFGGIQPPARVTPWKKIYSSEVGQILRIEVPTDLSVVGAQVYYLQFKARFPFDNVSWVVQAFQWQNEV